MLRPRSFSGPTVEQCGVRPDFEGPKVIGLRGLRTLVLVQKPPSRILDV